MNSISKLGRGRLFKTQALTADVEVIAAVAGSIIIVYAMSITCTAAGIWQWKSGGTGGTVVYGPHNAADGSGGGIWPYMQDGWIVGLPGKNLFFDLISGTPTVNVNLWYSQVAY